MDIRQVSFLPGIEIEIEEVFSEACNLEERKKRMKRVMNVQNVLTKLYLTLKF